MQTTLEPLTACFPHLASIDLGATLWPLRRGRGDPTMRVDPAGRWWRATWTPDGPATTLLRRGREGLHVQAWGPGAEWALGAVPELVGAHDSLEGFEPRGIVRELHRRFGGVRITRSRSVLQCLIPSVLEQKVTGLEARRSYRGLVLRWGHPAPGPGGLMLPPTAEEVAAIPYWSFHPLGVEQRRANVVRHAAGRASRVEEAVTMPLAAARRRLEALPGVGVWTAAEVARVALGDADAVSVGDYHVPHLVSWHLAGEPRGTDERMLELLAPYKGHRGRVQRLLELSGESAPRFGPRFNPGDNRRF